ncbi:carbohydrate porin [Pseudomonas aeruginosa]|nr:carbohydrate porin [Pseudomonas aeruginosa]
MHVTDWLTVRPNLQYIKQPGGVDEVDNALVAGIKIRRVLTVALPAPVLCLGPPERFGRAVFSGDRSSRLPVTNRLRFSCADHLGLACEM